MRRFSRNARVFSSFFIFIALVSLACGFPARQLNTTPPTPNAVLVPANPTASVPQVEVVTNEDQLLVDLYAKLDPSVVNVTIYQTQNGSQIPVGQASGFIFDSQGHIITNAHVVDGSDKFDVIFSDGLIREATTVGEDLFSDLAVLKVELPTGVNPIPLGTMENLAVGQSVIAIGNPFGFEGTLTSGIISALGRTIPSQTQYDIPQAIQTDAAINPGNSGGPLLNLKGEVVGVIDQIETTGTSVGNVGVGFAIPVSIVQRVIPALIETGHYDWPWLGVSGYTIYPGVIKAMSLPIEQGAYVSSVTDGGPSQSAGLKGTTETITQDGFVVEVGGDIITAIDGHPVKTFDDILVYLSLQTSPEQEVTLTILRDGKYQDIDVQLGTRPSG